MAAASAYKSLGLKSITFKISHRGLISGFLEAKKLGKFTTAVLRAVDKLDKLSSSQVMQELKQAGLNANDSKEIFSFVSIQGKTAEVVKKLNSLSVSHSSFTEAVERISQLGKLLQAG